MKVVILDAHCTNPGDLSWHSLSEFGEYKIYDRTPKANIIERAKEADIIVTNKTPLDKETLDSLPKLKFIALLSTGFNIVDVDHAKKRGIPVSNIPSYSTAAVAQLSFAFILEHLNNVAAHADAVREGQWSAAPDFCFTLGKLSEIQGKTLGIIGFGAIGRQVAKIAHAFDMKVLASSRSKPIDLPDYVTFTEQDRLLESSDIVSLHCPLNKETENMVNEGFLSKMQKSALLINTARGQLIDEEALASALYKGEIAGAGLDVLSQEPPKEGNPLIKAPNCLITPHIAWAGKETRERLLSIFFSNIKAFVEGSPINVVNP